MCRVLFFISIILLVLCCGVVVAGENTTVTPYVVNDTVESINTDHVIALESGHLNTSFSDGSKGYCIEYREQEAVVGDVFYKVTTDHAINSIDGGRVGNYLKLYFTDYTWHALGDSVVCQHMIWHFTDGFDGWRLNYTIINNIKNSDKIIPDYYVQSLNSTHERVWVFNVLLSLYEHHQDYFSYRFFDRLIILDNSSICNVSTNNNSGSGGNVTNNTSVCNECNVTSSLSNENKTYTSYKKYVNKDNNEFGVKMLVTGAELYNTISIIILCIIIISILCGVKRKYYE